MRSDKHSEMTLEVSTITLPLTNTYSDNTHAFNADILSSVVSESTKVNDTSTRFNPKILTSDALSITQTNDHAYTQGYKVAHHNMYLKNDTSNLINSTNLDSMTEFNLLKYNLNISTSSDTLKDTQTPSTTHKFDFRYENKTITSTYENEETITYGYEDKGTINSSSTNKENMSLKSTAIIKPEKSQENYFEQRKKAKIKGEKIKIFKGSKKLLLSENKIKGNESTTLDSDELINHVQMIPEASSLIQSDSSVLNEANLSRISPEIPEDTISRPLSVVTETTPLNVIKKNNKEVLRLSNSTKEDFANYGTLFSKDSPNITLNILQSRSRTSPEIKLPETVVATLEETSSLKRYTAANFPVRRTSTSSYDRNRTNRLFGEEFTISGSSRPEGPSSVCANDPCGAGVACHPEGKDKYQCVCSDGTVVKPGNPCPDVRPVNVTPPALSMNQDNDRFPKPSQGLMMGAVVTMSVLVLVLLMSVYWRRKKICSLMRHRNVIKLNKDASDSMTKISTLHTYNFASNPNYYTSPPDQLPLRSLSVLLISKDQINFLGELGEGCFGRVYKGEYDARSVNGNDVRVEGSNLSIANDGDRDCEVVEDGDVDCEVLEDGDIKKMKEKKFKKRIVAVKVLKELVGMEAEVDYLREVEIMASFKHPNILSLIGVVVAETEGTPWMVFEFMPYGDLAEVLRSCNKQYNKNYIPMKNLSKEELLDICLQVAAGMEYLSLQHYVHRDLACRNCLVGNNLTVKISDFGMSRDVYTCDYYKVGGSRMLPVRWMAPESILYGKFTLESDVWSFGVVLWEIYSFGKQPYYGNSNEEVVQLILQGILLSPSDDWPLPVIEIMRLSWSSEPHNRLTFPEIVGRLLHAKEELYLPNEEDQEQHLRVHSVCPQVITYSQLCIHDTPVKLQKDSDQYLMPKVASADEYLTVLQSV